MITKGEALGHINSIQCDITAPLEMKAMDIELRNLSILVGHNGSGKSLILKLNWAFGTIASIFVLNPEAMTFIDQQNTAQFILNHTFESQNFHGTIGATFEKAQIKITLDNGTVTDLEFTAESNVTEATPPMFMSTTLRTFAQIDQYLKVEALVKTQEGMLELYRLYDIAFMERLKGRLSGGLKVSEDVKKSLKDKFELRIDLDTVSIEDKSVVYTDSTGKSGHLSHLSNGEQSLINMCLANS